MVVIFGLIEKQHQMIIINILIIGIVFIGNTLIIHLMDTNIKQLCPNKMIQMTGGSY